MPSHKWNGTLALLALVSLSSDAWSQTASVSVVHSDPNGVVLPGEAISVRVVVSWQGAGGSWAQFAGLKGSSRASTAIGTAGAVNSAFGPPSILAVFGTPTLGDIVGHDIATISAYFTTTPHPASLQSAGVDYLTYDWTAPVVTTPTSIEINFVPDAIAPNVRLYTSTNSPAFVEAQTSYIGTSILVLPTPGVGGVVLSYAGLSASRRRRR